MNTNDNDLWELIRELWYWNLGMAACLDGTQIWYPHEDSYGLIHLLPDELRAL